MTTLVEMLHEDHIGMAALIDLLDEQVATMRRGDDADYHLMLEIAQYFTSFTDAQHHPCEDRLYDALRQRRHELARSLDSLAHDHEELGVLGVHMRDLLKAADAGEMTSREKILAACAAYVTRQRDHMGVEETLLMPTAAEHLDAALQENIARLCGRDPTRPDAGVPDERFRRIREALGITV
ncbi:MAG: hemerythrin domain-containing protein [Gammaproteobacteria bacterium]